MKTLSTLSAQADLVFQTIAIEICSSTPNDISSDDDHRQPQRWSPPSSTIPFYPRRYEQQIVSDSEIVAVLSLECNCFEYLWKYDLNTFAASSIFPELLRRIFRSGIWLAVRQTEYGVLESKALVFSLKNIAAFDAQSNSLL